MTRKTQVFKFKEVFQSSSPYIRIIYNKKKIIALFTLLFFLLIISFLTLSLFSRLFKSPLKGISNQHLPKPTPSKSSPLETPPSFYPWASDLPSLSYQKKENEELIMVLEKKLEEMKSQGASPAVVENYFSLAKDFLEKREKEKAKENLIKAVQLADEYLYYFQNKP